MSANKMSQKEYLKKYLSGDINKSEKVKKKKKKDKSSTKPRYVIKFTTNHTIVCSDMKKDEITQISWHH